MGKVAGNESEGMLSGRHARPACAQEPGYIAPFVDFKRCEGKGECVRVCPENVFQLRRIEAADDESMPLLNRFKLRLHGMNVAYTPNSEACRSCGLCVSACPEKAITLHRVCGPE